MFKGEGKAAFPLTNESREDWMGFNHRDDFETIVVGPGVKIHGLDLRYADRLKTVVYIDNDAGYITVNDNVIAIEGVDTTKDVTIWRNYEDTTCRLKSYTPHGDEDARPIIKEILANTALNDEAKALIPKECGGIGANPVHEKYIDDWAKPELNKL